MKQHKLFNDKVELIKVDSVIGYGYEEEVAKLAIEDKIAYRAARKNMQIHSAIILKINDEFAGFFTYEVNHIVGEFCLLQSAMYPGKEDKSIYSMMIQKNLGLGLSYAGFLFGNTIIINSAFSHEHHDITSYLIQVILKITSSTVMEPSGLINFL